MMRKHWFALSMLSLVLFMGLSGCIQQFQPLPIPGNYASEEFKQTYAVDPETVLEVYNTNGDITVTTWGNERVEVYALKETQYGQEELDKVSIEVSTGAIMVVKAQYPSLQTVRVSVQFEIKVPAAVAVERLESSNGGILLKGTTGDASLHTSNGAITVKDVDGYVRASTSNGPIQIEDVTGVLGADTSNGAITVEIPVLDSDVEITTSNGAVTVYIAEDLDANIVIDTSNGKISLHEIQMTVKELSATRVEGTLGNGGYDLTIHTSNGNINLFKLG